MAAPNIANPTTITGKSVGYAVTTSIAAALSNSAASGKAFRVTYISCANVDGVNAADITVTHYNGTTDSHIAKTIPVPADATQVLLSNGHIWLEEGHSIRASASAASDLELLIAYEEFS